MAEDRQDFTTGTVGTPGRSPSTMVHPNHHLVLLACVPSMRLPFVMRACSAACTRRDAPDAVHIRLPGVRSVPVRSSEAPKTRRAPKTDAPQKPGHHADLGALAEVCCSAVVRARLHHRHRLHTLSGRHGRFACLPRSYGHVAGCMGAQCVQCKRTHHARPAGAKKPILIRCFRP